MAAWRAAGVPMPPFMGIHGSNHAVAPRYPRTQVLDLAIHPAQQILDRDLLMQAPVFQFRNRNVRPGPRSRQRHLSPVNAGREEAKDETDTYFHGALLLFAE